MKIFVSAMQQTSFFDNRISYLASRPLLVVSLFMKVERQAELQWCNKTAFRNEIMDWIFRVTSPFLTCIMFEHGTDNFCLRNCGNAHQKLPTEEDCVRLHIRPHSQREAKSFQSGYRQIDSLLESGILVSLKVGSYHCILHL